MAVTAATVRSDFSGFLPAEIANPIFERAANQSVVMQLATQVPLGANGKSVPIVTGRPVAGWVSEGAQKPATKGTMTLATMTPQKLAAIVVVSDEVVRSDPGQYVSALRGQLSEAFALAFDAAALHDKLADGTSTGPFSTYVDQTTKAVELGSTAPDDGGIYIDFNQALSDLVTDRDASGRRYRLTGWALDSVTEPLINGSVDANGRPLFVDSPLTDQAGPLRSGRLMGRPAFVGEGVGTYNGTSVVGYAGDWSQAAWGVVGGINFRVSNDATVTINGSLVSLFENNLTAIRAEAEYGFLLADDAAFVKFTNAIAISS